VDQSPRDLANNAVTTNALRPAVVPHLEPWYRTATDKQKKYFNNYFRKPESGAPGNQYLRRVDRKQSDTLTNMEDEVERLWSSSTTYKNFHGTIPMSKQKVPNSRRIEQYIREMFKPSAHSIVRLWIDALPEDDFSNLSSVLRALSCVCEEAINEVPYFSRYNESYYKKSKEEFTHMPKRNAGARSSAMSVVGSTPGVAQVKLSGVPRRGPKQAFREEDSENDPSLENADKVRPFSAPSSMGVASVRKVDRNPIAQAIRDENPTSMYRRQFVKHNPAEHRVTNLGKAFRENTAVTCSTNHALPVHLIPEKYANPKVVTAAMKEPRRLPRYTRVPACPTKHLYNPMWRDYYSGSKTSNLLQYQDVTRESSALNTGAVPGMRERLSQSHITFNQGCLSLPTTYQEKHSKGGEMIMTGEFKMEPHIPAGYMP
jgi:hypothetical protein